jgi:hypothetical protein
MKVRDAGAVASRWVAEHAAQDPAALAGVVPPGS